jgi:hypothetical protein
MGNSEPSIPKPILIWSNGGAALFNMSKFISYVPAFAFSGVLASLSGSLSAARQLVKLDLTFCPFEGISDAQLAALLSSAAQLIDAAPSLSTLFLRGMWQDAPRMIEALSEAATGRGKGPPLPAALHSLAAAILRHKVLSSVDKQLTHPQAELSEPVDISLAGAVCHVVFNGR